jgi:hypothetical protein
MGALMAAEYRVVFAGAVLEGYDAETVKETAGHRLKVTSEQLTRLFSGKPVVLKKGLEFAAAEQYVAELNRIGMKVRVESVPGSTPQKVESYAPPPAPQAPQEATPFPSLTLVDQDAPVSSRATPALTDPANVPTFVVPKNHIEATRQRLEEALAAHDDPSLAPTVIISPAQAAEARLAAQTAAANAATSPTLIVPRPGSNAQSSIAVMAEETEHLHKPAGKNKEAERTLIADEDALNAYLSASGGTGPIGIMDPAGPALTPVTPPAPSPIPALDLQLEREVAPVAPAIAPPVAPALPPILVTPPAPGIPAAIPAEEVAPVAPPPVPAAVPAPPPIRRTLPKTLPQEAAMLASRPEREAPPPPNRGLALPIKILLAVVAVGGIAGLGLLIWIIVGM